MVELIKASIGFCVLMLGIWAAGYLLMRGLKMKTEISLVLIFGYLLYFSVFELLAVPMTLKWVKLSQLSYIWAALLVIVISAGLILVIKNRKKESIDFSMNLKGHSWMLILVGIVVLIQCLIVVLYQDTTVDATYYVGTVSTSVYTDTLGRYHPYTGKIQKFFDERYIFSAYPMHNAVWCKLFGMHAIVQSKMVMAVMNVLIANLITYRIGLMLFEMNKKKADMMVCFVCLLQLFTGTIYSPGTFFFTRIFEGKALLANVSIPAVLYGCLWLWNKVNDRGAWILLFLASLSAVTFSGSAIYLPVALCAGILPTIIRNRKPFKLVWLGICMFPEIAYMLLYYSAKLELIVLSAS